MKLDVIAAASAAASAETEVVYEASSLRWGSLKMNTKVGIEAHNNGCN